MAHSNTGRWVLMTEHAAKNPLQLEAAGGPKPHKPRRRSPQLLPSHAPPSSPNVCGSPVSMFHAAISRR